MNPRIISAASFRVYHNHPPTSTSCYLISGSENNGVRFVLERRLTRKNETIKRQEIATKIAQETRCPLEKESEGSGNHQEVILWRNWDTGSAWVVNVYIVFVIRRSAV